MFARHPNLKIVSAESGIGWLPYAIERMDHVYNKHRFWLNVDLPELPSTYLAQNVYATFIKDDSGVAARDRIGLDRIMWSSDYPHGDSTWPHSQAVIQDNYGYVPEDELQKVVVGQRRRGVWPYCLATRSR